MLSTRRRVERHVTGIRYAWPSSGLCHQAEPEDVPRRQRVIGDVPRRATEPASGLRTLRMSSIDDSRTLQADQQRTGPRDSLCVLIDHKDLIRRARRRIQTPEDDRHDPASDRLRTRPARTDPHRAQRVRRNRCGRRGGSQRPQATREVATATGHRPWSESMPAHHRARWRACDDADRVTDRLSLLRATATAAALLLTVLVAAAGCGNDDTQASRPADPPALSPAREGASGIKGCSRQQAAAPLATS